MNILLKFLFMAGVSIIFAVALTTNITASIFIWGIIGISLVWFCGNKIK